MRWLDLAFLAVYLQAFVWYGRLSYVQGVLDHRWTPDEPRVQKVLHADKQLDDRCQLQMTRR